MPDPETTRWREDQIEGFIAFDLAFGATVAAIEYAAGLPALGAITLLYVICGTTWEWAT